MTINSSAMRIRFRLRLLLAGGLGLVLALAIALTNPSPSKAHYAGFTGGYTFEYFIYNNERTIFSTVHSYSFVSASDTGGRNELVCPELVIGGDPVGECGWGFERYCFGFWNHSADDLDCHDRDGYGWRFAVWNRGGGDAVGERFKIHATY